MPKICLDPGHAGAKYNQSTEVSTYYESAQMWTLHLMLKSALESYGFEVITTRGAIDTNPELYNRGATSRGCDCFISLHSNACGTESVDYPVIYRAFDNLNNADTISLKLSKAIGVLMGTKQEGKTATNKSTTGAEVFGVMCGARGVSCPLYMLIEHSFHTNKAATLWLLDDGNLQKLADLEAKILAEHYGLSRDSVKVESVPLISTEGFSVGDTVTFSGNTHYASANGTDGKPCVGGTAVVTATCGSTKHPVHIKGDKSPCTAFGWVNAEDVAKV